MPALLRRPGSAGARPCQGRSSLDRACAPAEYGSYREAQTGKISQVKVPTLSGEPRLATKTAGHWGAASRDHRPYRPRLEWRLVPFLGPLAILRGRSVGRPACREATYARIQACFATIDPFLGTVAVTSR
jgi:hypothetical protein